MKILDRIKTWRQRNGASQLSMEEMAEAMIEDAAKSAMKCFKDEKFQKIAQWEKGTEQRDAMVWNELLATAVCTVMFVVDESIQYVPGDKREYWRAVQEALKPAFWSLLKLAGITEENLAGWQQFLAMRQEVATMGQEEVAAAYGKRFSRLSTPDREMTVRVTALVTACHLNLRSRGGEPIQALAEYLECWIGDFDHQCQRRMQK